jgi:glutathione S-transferase
MPHFKLISHNLCPYVQRARIVLEEKHVPHDLEFIDLAAKPAWFKEISPLGKVPVLLVDGRPLFESSVIAEYLDEVIPGSLHPVDTLEKARHRSWIEFASSTLDNIGRFYSAKDAQAFEHQRLDLVKKFKRLEAELDDGPWFAGEDFSLVDAAFAPVFRYFEVFEEIANFDFFDDTPRVNAWREALRKRPSVRLAVVEDYHDLLRTFVSRRRSHLSTLMGRSLAA